MRDFSPISDDSVGSKESRKKCKKIPPIVLIPLYGFFTGFKPSDPYLTTYLRYNRGFSSTVVVDIIYPSSTYSTPIFMIFFALISPFIPSYKILLYFGYICQLLTFGLLSWGTNLASMVAMQVTYAATCAAEAVYFSVLYFFVDKTIYQKCSALSRSSILVAHVISAVLGQLLVSLVEDFNQQNLFIITFAVEAINLVFLIMMPNGGASTIYEKKNEIASDENEKESDNSVINSYNSSTEYGNNIENNKDESIQEINNLSTYHGNEEEFISQIPLYKADVKEQVNLVPKSIGGRGNRCPDPRRLLFLFDTLRSDHLGVSATLMSLITNATHCLFLNFAFNILDEIEGAKSKLNGICSTVGRLLGVLGSFLAPIVLKHNKCFPDEQDLKIKPIALNEKEQISATSNEENKQQKKSKGSFASFAVSFCVIPVVFVLLAIASFVYGIANTTVFTIVMFAIYYCLSEFALTMSWGCVALRTTSKAYPSVFVFTMFLSYLLQTLVQSTFFSNVAPSIFGLSIVRSHYIYIGFVNLLGAIIVGCMGIAHACKLKNRKRTLKIDVIESSELDYLNEQQKEIEN